MKKAIFLLVIVLIMLGCSNNITNPPENYAKITNPIHNGYYQSYSTINFEIQGTNINKISIWTSSDEQAIKDNEYPFIIPITITDERSLTIYSNVTFNDGNIHRYEITIFLEG